MNISQYLASRRKPRSTGRTWAGQPVQPTIRNGRIIMPPGIAKDSKGETCAGVVGQDRDTGCDVAETTKTKRAAGGLGGPLPDLARELQAAWDTGEYLF